VIFTFTGDLFNCDDEEYVGYEDNEYADNNENGQDPEVPPLYISFHCNTPHQGFLLRSLFF
jgi:hypothetical protein